MIRLERVSYAYPDDAGRALPPHPALVEVDLEVEEGEFLLLAGPSGSGKSTLLRCLNGLVPHFYGGTFSGKVSVLGQDPVAWGPGRMSRLVGMVFQNPEAQCVAPTVEEELAFAMENHGFPEALMRQRIEEVMDWLGISHLRGRRLETLSGGERQRVAIGAVLTLRPRLLLLDEPTSQLDPRGAEEILDVLEGLRETLGLTIVLAEHRLERVVGRADRILYLRNYLTQLQRAVREGLPIKGYFLWSLMDNFEWAEGYEPRFGIIYVDYRTLERKPKRSAHWYREVIAANAIEA